MRRWLLLVAGSATDRYQITFLEDVLGKCSSTDDSSTVLFLFSYLTEPQPKLTHSLFGGAFDADMRGTNYFLNELWDNVFKPALPALAGSFLTIADRHLRQADLELDIADDNGSDRNRPSAYRLAIESVPDDQYGSPLGFLVDVARDCLESLLDSEAPEGYSRLDAWAASDVILLRRLTIHGWIQRKDKTSSEKIHWLRETGWLRSDGLRYEMSRLITHAIGSADASAADDLVAEILSRADEDQFAPRWAHTWLTRITEAAPALESAQEALTSLVAAHPEVADQPSSASEETQSAWSKPPPATANEFHRKVANELSQTVEALNAYAADRSRFEDRERWDRLAGVISDTVREWPDDGFSLLDAVGSGHPDIDRAVLWGWARAEPDAELAARILQRVRDLDLRPIVNDVTFMLAGFAPQGSAAVEWHNVSESGDLAKTCWEAMGPDATSGVPDNDDLAVVAANHPAGRLALFWVTAVRSAWIAARDTWSGIPPEVADYLHEMLDAHDNRGEMVEVIFGQHLHFFYEADTEWCNQRLLPRFDWNETDRARRVWDGYLSGGRWNNRLVAEGFVQKLLATLAHRDDFRADKLRHLFIQLADISIYADTDPRTWLRDLITQGSPADRVDWAEALGYELSGVEPVLAEREWHRWMGDYWSNRTRSVPRELDAAEASAMARWALFFTDSMEAGIDLALKSSTAGFGTDTPILNDLTNDRIDRAPEKLAQMVGHLLSSTELPDGQSFHYGRDLQRIYRRLSEHRVPDDALGVIAEEAMRLRVDLG
jgi:uncharacterized protein DUF4020